MSNSDYKQTVEDLSVEIFIIHTSMLAASEENEKLVLKVKMLETRNEELELACRKLNIWKTKTSVIRKLNLL